MPVRMVKLVSENELIDILSRGLSWRDSRDAIELADLLDEGNTVSWQNRVLQAAEEIGVPRVLHQIEFSYQKVVAWGAFAQAVLSLFGLGELSGLSCDMSEFVRSIREKNPSSWKKARKYAKECAIRYLKGQIAAGDVYLLRPSAIQSPDLAVYVPEIIEVRRREKERAAAYLMEDGMVDMFDLLELPIAMELIVKSGIGGRSDQDSAKEVLSKLVELGVTSNGEPVAKSQNLVSVEERYLRLYQNCMPNHRDLLRGVAMTLDPDNKMCLQGLEMIYASGHGYAREALLKALDRSDDAIIKYAIAGLGILGDREAIERISGFLGHHSKDVVCAACGVLGQLQATEKVDDLFALVGTSDDEIRIAALRALAKINSPRAHEKVWQCYSSLGISKFSLLTAQVADRGSDTALYFMIDLLLLDVHTFVRGGEMMLFNAIQNPPDNMQNVLQEAISILRDRAVEGFGRIGSRAVPILVTLLNQFPDAEGIVSARVEWKKDEQEIRHVLYDRLREYQQLRHVTATCIPDPVEKIVRALGMTKSARAIPYLKDIANSRNVNLAKIAVESLSEIDTPAIDALIEVSESNPTIHALKVQQIGTIVHPRATKWLVKQSTSKNPMVRLQTGMFLAMRNDPALIKPLRKLAKDSEVGVRMILANVITRLGLNAYPEIMEILSKDSAEIVRDTITRAKLHFEAEKNDEFWA